MLPAAFLALLFCLTLPSCSFLGDGLAGYLSATVGHFSVHDGDTLEATNSEGSWKIRLLGIDAPELDQPFGPEARETLSNLASTGPFTLRWRKKDAYGRFLGVITGKNGVCWNSWLCEEGYAWAFVRYAEEVPTGLWEGVMQGETTARSARKGLWSRPGPIEPWVWRER